VFPKGDQFVSGSSDKTVKVWDAAKGKCLMTLEGHSDAVRRSVVDATHLKSLCYFCGVISRLGCGARRWPAVSVVSLVDIMHFKNNKDAALFLSNAAIWVNCVAVSPPATASSLRRPTRRSSFGTPSKAYAL
jgi:WD40 repeat protein